MLWKSTLREIKTSFERYLAIFAIVALGVGFFSGLQVCKPSMIATCEKYLDKTNMYDYQLLTSYGVDDESVNIALKNKDVLEAETSIQKDAFILCNSDKSDEIQEYSYRIISIPQSINTLSVKEGRLPEKAGECVVDNYNSGAKIGEKIKLSDSNDKDTLDSLKCKEFTVVGRVSTPIFLDYQRGSSDIGNGQLEAFMFVTSDTFTLDYATQLFIKLKGGTDYFADNAEDFLDSKEESMKALAKEINNARRDKALKEGQKKLDESRNEYEDGVAEYESQVSTTYAKLEASATELRNNEATLNSQKTQVQGQIAQLEQALQDPSLTPEMKAVYEQKLAEAKAGLSQIEVGLAQVAEGWKQYESGKATADAEFASAKAKLDDAKKKLDDAKKKLDEMNTGSSYAMTRYENSGFSVFEENANIVKNIAKVFPLFFFLVAALVCMTTMTRMIDEQRTQIGIMKALGYSNSQVLGKYMFYSGSAAFMGAIFGFFFGCWLFPKVIWNAYGMMYDFESHLEYELSWKLGLIALAVALLCSMGATWVSCAADFKVAPAELIRPKTPKAGKRILLERFTALWNKISFLYKVSFRNIFRYKKRFFMMVLGISGCTALLIAGFGINSSIKKVAEYQFKEIQKYDYRLVFESDMDQAAQDEIRKAGGDDMGDILFLQESSVQLKFSKKNADVTMVVSDGKDFSKFIDLHTGKDKIDFPKDGEVVVCEKLKKQYGVNIGDTITVRDGMKEAKFKVSAICDNYVFDYIYVSAASYEKAFGRAAEHSTGLVKAPEKATDAQIRAKATDLSSNSKVAAAVVNLDTLDMVDNMMKSLNAVVLVVILCAGLLAFIVLYNLTNINITERIREIATIKVLGFYRKEISQYVFRENLFLTAISVLVGIPLGKILLDFVMVNINVNSIHFVTRITLLDYACSAALTFVFTFIVNIALSKRLHNISMTESLKSIE